MESDERIMNVKPCDHVPLVRRDLPMHPRCDACVAAGDTWVHPRAAAHPVIRSAEPGESWLWCFVHDRQVG
jgi:hypothetical protein